MTDAYVPQGNKWDNVEAFRFPKILVPYAGPIAGAYDPADGASIIHPWMSPSHLKRNQNYSAGLNVLTVDCAVRWFNHRPFEYPDTQPNRPRVRYVHYYNQMFW